MQAKDLIGAWQLVIWTLQHPDGSESHPLGKDGLGYIIYSPRASCRPISRDVTAAPLLQKRSLLLLLKKSIKSINNMLLIADAILLKVIKLPIMWNIPAFPTIMVLI